MAGFSESTSGAHCHPFGSSVCRSPCDIDNLHAAPTVDVETGAGSEIR